ncbi:MAG TPA: hypothetical protein VGH82_06520 [Gaiellaceae bacterium]|jgi:hypothetical protein
MNILDRFRRFWGSAPSPDHPLSEQERDEDRVETAYDERADTIERFVDSGPNRDD